MEKLEADHFSTRGGGGTPLYKLCRYVPPQRVWFLGRFGLKTGIDLACMQTTPISFTSKEIGVVCTQASIDFEHYGLKLGVLPIFLPFWLRRGTFLRLRVKLGRENHIFWSENRQGFKEAGGTTPSHTLRSTPPPQAFRAEHFAKVSLVPYHKRI